MVAAVVTPTINELEQAAFYASEDNSKPCVSLRRRDDDADNDRCRADIASEERPATGSGGPILPELEGWMLEAHRAQLPNPSFRPFRPSPAATFAAAAAIEKESLENDSGRDRDEFEIVASSSSAASSSNEEVLLQESTVSPEEEENQHGDDADAILDAAGILCNFKNDVVDIRTVTPQDAADIVDLAAEMLSDTKKKPQEEEVECDDSTEETEEQRNDDDDYWEYCRPVASNYNDAFAPQRIATNNLPDRLATEDDSEEVNKLHQYVRRDLLEIFVVPPAADATACVDDSEDEDEGGRSGSRGKKRPLGGAANAANADNATRRTRRRSIAPAHAPPPSSAQTQAQRHYPGRVGMRCVHCAHHAKKSTSKAAFYPLRLKNIYREVCAWQRIHFKRCPHVPADVRERYDEYKRIDPSRGKVRYWETSARRIGLVNNPDRDDGVVFDQTAWKA
eukprot:CAMPEP_0181135168 /NCGR_PEP_ID=MMETSP1071-20121207/32478_1 /TAXON_ID=35127 /ORGANISM="Thalassiosira sp., Strain NH16" /LENGTH=450 /DNA_ID=CAMNT_0023221737 /DNA_START=190 /DNA_END=1542 /DNA_ORIENTATION=+